jgi:hypothetical protein
VVVVVRVAGVRMVMAGCVVVAGCVIVACRVVVA